MEAGAISETFFLAGLILNFFLYFIISLFKARRMSKPGCEDKICVIVGTVTDDVRLLEVPKLKVFAFCFEISRQ